MFQITSSRLKLIPLMLPQIRLLAKSRNILERSLNLNLSDFELNADLAFLEEFSLSLEQFVIPLVSLHPDDYLWFTHWLIVHQDLNLSIGGIGGARFPDQQGQVMIGYFINKKFKGQD